MPVALIVEDDDDIRDALTDVVERAGFAPRTATNGAEALRFLGDADDLPTVIVLDLMMPVMDGWEFLERRDDRLRSIPIVAITAKRNPTVPDGITVVRKPFSVESIEAALRAYWR